jgi:hypothetical protein
VFAAVVAQIAVGSLPGAEICVCMPSCAAEMRCCERCEHKSGADHQACPCHNNCPTCIKVQAPERAGLLTVRIVGGTGERLWAAALPPAFEAVLTLSPLSAVHLSPSPTESPPHLALVRSIHLNV